MCLLVRHLNVEGVSDLQDYLRDAKSDHKQNEKLFQNRLSMTRYASSILTVFFLILFFISIPNDVSLTVFYGLMTGVMFMIFIACTLIIKDNSINTFWVKFIPLYPILIVSIAAMSIQLDQNYVAESLLFYGLIFIVSFLSINTYRYVLILFGFAMALLSTSIFLKYGFDLERLFTTVLFLSLGSGFNLFFNRILKTMIDTNEKLQDGYYELEYTKNIAHMMMGITSYILSNENIDSLLDVIITKAVEVTPKATAGTIMLKEGDHMRYAAAYGYDIARLSQIRVKFSDTFQYQTGNFNKPELVQDTESFNKLKASPDFVKQLEALNIPHSQSVITCPIIVNGEIYGSINLDNLEQPHAFKESEKPIVQYLSEQISLALINQQLLSKTLYYTKHDMLTDAYTRTYHQKLLNKAFNHAKLGHHSFCFAILDINNMKYINDTWGHQAGDDVLVHFSKNTYKQLDHHGHLSRIGGDEFSIIFEQSNFTDASKVIEKMQRSFEANKIVIDNQPFAIKFAAGIACYPEDGDNLTTLFSVADKRMYHNKNKIKLESSKE